MDGEIIRVQADEGSICGGFFCPHLKSWVNLSIPKCSIGGQQVSPGGSIRWYTAQLGVLIPHLESSLAFRAILEWVPPEADPETRI